MQGGVVRSVKNVKMTIVSITNFSILLFDSKFLIKGITKLYAFHTKLNKSIYKSYPDLHMCSFLLL